MESFQEKPVEEYTKDTTGDDITPCLQARDAAWRKKMETTLTDTFKEAQDEIDSQLRSSAPILLVSKAQGALNSIDSNTASFKSNGKQLLAGLEKLITTAEELKNKING